MMVTDGLAPTWRQDISYHHDDVNHSVQRGPNKMITRTGRNNTSFGIKAYIFPWLNHTISHTQDPHQTTNVIRHIRIQTTCGSHAWQEICLRRWTQLGCITESARHDTPATCVWRRIVSDTRGPCTLTTAAKRCPKWSIEMMIKYYERRDSGWDLGLLLTSKLLSR